MDYYKLSNDLRYQCQLLQKLSQNVFEVALNASILSENITKSNAESLAISSISDNLGQISKELVDEINKLLDFSSNICRFTLGIKRNYILYFKLNDAAKIISLEFERNKIIVDESLISMKEEIKDLVLKTLENIEVTKFCIKKIKKLNEKIWVSLNNIKIEMAINNQIANFENICLQLDEISHTQNNILMNINQSRTNLIQELENEMEK